MISLLPRFKRRLSPSFIASEAGAGEALQKLRVAYAAVTAAFSIPWIAKEAGIFQKHGLDVELVYIAAGSRAVQTLVGGSIDVAVIGGPAGVDAKLAGADPKDFVDPRLLKEIEASGFVKKLYGEGK